ncbi:MAG: AAA family ATPase [Candidatus Pacebacteria bacterium]|nr:AAA family ATPase [Candidatus Paceibacterota bacterium]
MDKEENKKLEYQNFIKNSLLVTPKGDWDKEVWPKLQNFNSTKEDPFQDEDLSELYVWVKDYVERNIKTDDSQYSPSLSHYELLSKEFSPARYTIEPFFEQGTMNMVSAPPNTWKSWLLFLFAGHIVSGTAVFDKFQTEKASVMIVNEEDSARLIQDRLRLLNITDTSLLIYYRIAQGSKLNPEFIESLLKEAKEKDIGVIMFDSLRAIHSADENDSTAMQEVMDLLKKIARESITVIFTHHHRKKSMFSKNVDTESSRGSSAINAAISGHMSLEESNKDGQISLVVKHLKSKVGEKLQPFDLEVDIGEVISFKYLGDHKPAEKALSEAKIKIINELQERKELLGRKDFVFLKIGGDTSIKEATKYLEKEGKIKVMTRKEAEMSGRKIFNTVGKPNEKLYFVEEEISLDVFDDT